MNQREARVINQMRDALNGVLWLGNNLHNIEADPDMFRQFYESMQEDAEDALREYQKLAEEAEITP